LLAEHLLAKHAGRIKPVLSAEAVEQLMGYSFPGNVRELENILERALIYCGGGIIRAEDIDLHRTDFLRANGNGANGGSAGGVTPINAAANDNIAAPAETLDKIERQAIIDALARCNGNRTRAAELLGISRKTILNKIKLYGLE
jgi:two-component system response regulator AtoC